ncbi:hypothetical protein A8C56_16145 [Niabella ginsenosidivorans]|uniref:Glycosyltransferase 2-like domain-containing protein n=1 Tax=Niabella ginsenosidivorans TaxID=1176587 RepID=A0A1A9I6W8_9BACT|nr:glycosyltransferase [Niabella ginsenosidivorans]ANH82284.1 hypothetical protein A8C56_16145 [Niabella ginsenosidivorans]
MASKKFTRKIDKMNDKVCYRLVHKYYLWKEGVTKKLVDMQLIRLLSKRFFYLFILLFRFNKYPRKVQYMMPKDFAKRLLGLYHFHKAGIPRKLRSYPSLVFPVFEAPEVTIIIAVFNQWQFTYNCLKSILEHTGDIPYHIVVVDDGSADETASCLQHCENITVIRNEQNIGFLRSCNKAAGGVRSKYICFLNNDTMVSQRWLYHMVNVFKLHDDAGVVGAKLLYPYGLLQEAGGLVNATGEPANYGRWTDPREYQYNYLRETDYCSGACILIQTQDFLTLKGFNEQYAPAYYEDTDLCFAARFRLGKKVFYQPLAEVVHFEGISSGKRAEKGNVKNYQLHNAKTFVNTWKSYFNRFSDSNLFDNQVDKFSRNRKRILIIEGFLPSYDKDSGSRRVYELIKIFFSLDLEVYFMPEFGGAVEPYYSELVTRGVRVFYEQQYLKSKQEMLREILPVIDYAWVARPHSNEAHASLIKEQKNIVWIYDTVDLHFLRLERSLAYDQSQHITKKDIDVLKEKELALSREADVTVVVTPFEKNILIKAGTKHVKVIPNIHPVKKGTAFPSFEEREGLCFIGGYEHLPNVDAVLWLVKEIMPLVWTQAPGIKLALLGSHPPPEVLALRSDLIAVPGYIHDVSSYFNNSRLFVAPLRYGAGMKGKIGHAMEYGLPAVATDIGVEGMGLEVNRDIAVANTAETFAAEILDLYSNRERWMNIARHSVETIRRYSPEVVQGLVKELIMGVAKQ